MKATDKILEGFSAFDDEMSGAKGYFERQAYVMRFMVEILDATRNYAFGVGPKPVLQFESPVELAEKPVQRDLANYGDIPPPNGDWPSAGYSGGNGDIPSIVQKMRNGDMQPDPKSELAAMLAHNRRNGRS